jgi:hypothetical protein
VALACSVVAAGGVPAVAAGAATTTPTTTTSGGSTGPVPVHFAPIPRVSAAPAARARRARTYVQYDEIAPSSQPLRLESPPPPVGPLPARPPVRSPSAGAPVLPRAVGAAPSSLNLTLLVWISFLVAAVAAGAVGIAHRVRTRPSGTNVFGRPTNEIDEWLASAELAATTAPAPVDPDAAEPGSTPTAPPPADPPAATGQ